jgi:hypothetical protein
MRQVVPQVVEVGPGLLRAHWLPDRRGVGECLIPGGDPQPVEDPAVAGIVVESGRVALGPQGGDLPEQCLEPQQGVMVRAKAGAHRGDAVTRSRLTWSLRSAPVGEQHDLGAEQVRCGALEAATTPPRAGRLC